MFGTSTRAKGQRNVSLKARGDVSDAEVEVFGLHSADNSRDDRKTLLAFSGGLYNRFLV